MKNFSIAFFLLFSFMFVPMEMVNAAETRDISVEQAKQKIAQGALVIDVRSAKEFSAGHLPKALNIPHDELESNIDKIGKAKNQEIIVYCRGGKRAAKAKETLSKLGYTQVFNGGGYESLSK